MSAGLVQTRVKIRHTVVVDALVVGVTGTLAHPDALVLAQRDQVGDLHAVGLSIQLRPPARAALVGRLRQAGEPRQLPSVVSGLPGRRGADYLPVAPTVTVEVEADPAQAWGAFRHRPHVLRARTEP